MGSGLGNKRGSENVVSNWQLRYNVDSLRGLKPKTLSVRLKLGPGGDDGKWWKACWCFFFKLSFFLSFF